MTAHPLEHMCFVALTRGDEGDIPAGLAVSYGRVLFALPDDGVHFMVEVRSCWSYLVYMPAGANDPQQKIVSLEDLKCCIWYEDEDEMLAALEGDFRSAWEVYEKAATGWVIRPQPAEPPKPVAPIPIERAKSMKKDASPRNYVVDEDRARRLRERRDA
jgi:hypothetical protein